MAGWQERSNPVSEAAPPVWLCFFLRSTAVRSCTSCNPCWQTVGSQSEGSQPARVARSAEKPRRAPSEGRSQAYNRAGGFSIENESGCSTTEAGKTTGSTTGVVILSDPAVVVAGKSCLESETCELLSNS